VKKVFLLALVSIFICRAGIAQTVSQNIQNPMQGYEDSLKYWGSKFINDEDELERINANHTFIKTLVKALKTPDSFQYPFDSVKTISILNSPDNRFRIFSWPIAYNDGSYRFYGAIQINTGGSLKLFPLNDDSFAFFNPQDTISDNLKWYGAEYYRIIPVYSPHLYYVLLGWKGNSAKSTKKVIEVLSFINDKPVFGRAVFDEKTRVYKRIVFEYTRQASMLLRYIPDLNLIVFDHLAPPEEKLRGQKDTYGPDLSYDGFRLRDGRWQFVENLDMRNVPENRDDQYIDPKKQAQADKKN
jgi:hypothetical protein